MITTSIQVQTAGAQAITTAQGKQHIHVEYDTAADNTEIDNMIQAATQQVEAFTGRICMPTVIDFHLSGFPTGGIVLPFSPVTTLTSVKYYDSSNVQQTWAATNYYVSLYEEPLRIRYVNDSYPTVYQYRMDAVTVRFTCGYADADAVPRSMRQAILLKLGEYYGVRGDAVREKFTLWQMTCYHDRVFHTPNENAV